MFSVISKSGVIHLYDLASEGRVLLALEVTFHRWLTAMRPAQAPLIVEVLPVLEFVFHLWSAPLYGRIKLYPIWAAHDRSTLPFRCGA